MYVDFAIIFLINQKNQ